jgi:TonB family protein
MTAWILYSLALSALAGAAALAGEAAMRMYRRPTRWVWAAALLVSCAGPVLLAARRPVASGGGAAGAPVVMRSAPLTAPRPAPPSLARRVEGALPALWAGASALILGGIAAGAAVMRRRRGGWSEGRLAGVPVLVSPAVGPAVAGVIRPRIVVPRWTLGWSEPLQRLLVRHESEHIRAGDPRLILAATLAAALVPWNLAAWWQLRRLRLAVEVDCDTRTLRGGGDVATYGDLLLRVGALGSGMAFPAAAFAEPRSFLERRIRAMTSRTPRNRAARAAAFAALTLGVAGTAYALPAPSAPEIFRGLFPALPAPGTVRAALRDTTPALDISQVDTPPQLANPREVSAAIRAAYPPALRAAGQRGLAVVDLVVRADGTPQLSEPSPAPHEFETAARRAALQMRFRPAQKGGAPVAARVRIPVSFEPEPPETSTVITETVSTVKN